MTVLRLSAAATRKVNDPAHPEVRLSAAGAWSPDDLAAVASHLQHGDCVHVTVTTSHEGRLSVLWRRPAPARGETGGRDSLAALARVAGADASRVLVRIERQPSPPRRAWGAWAWWLGACQGHRIAT